MTLVCSDPSVASALEGAHASIAQEVLASTLEIQAERAQVLIVNLGESAPVLELDGTKVWVALEE